jgi:hypothetical protein
MNLKDLADLMGKSITEVEAMLNKQDTIEVRIIDGRQQSFRDSGEIKVLF